MTKAVSFSLTMIIGLAVGARLAGARTPLDRPTPPPCCADGVCHAHAQSFGYFQTRWRMWPGIGEAPMPAVQKPTTMQVPGVPPYEVPPPEKEDQLAPPPTKSPQKPTITIPTPTTTSPDGTTTLPEGSITPPAGLPSSLPQPGGLQPGLPLPGLPQPGGVQPTPQPTAPRPATTPLGGYSPPRDFDPPPSPPSMGPSLGPALTARQSPATSASRAKARPADVASLPALRAPRRTDDDPPPTPPLY
jgi:hypothetical protein